MCPFLWRGGRRSDETVHQSMVRLPGCKSGCGKEFEDRDVVETKDRIRNAVDELSGEQRVLVMCPWRNYIGRDLAGLKELADRSTTTRWSGCPALA